MKCFIQKSGMLASESLDEQVHPIGRLRKEVGSPEAEQGLCHHKRGGSKLVSDREGA